MKRLISMTRIFVFLLAAWVSFAARAEEDKANGVLSALNSTTISGYVDISGQWVAADSLPSVGVVASRTTAWERPPSVRVARSASFRFFRSGDLSAPLTVRYTLGGTARQAVDYTVSPDGGYRPLPIGTFWYHWEPSQIVIPAGSRSALLTVEPIDDRIVEGFEKVTMQLVYPNPQMYPVASAESPTNAVQFVFEVRPDYVLQRRGYPSRATIHIVDDDWGRGRNLR
jgi:hypothetical protein